MKRRGRYLVNRPTQNRLRFLRSLRQWTQDDVAYKLGYSTKFRYWQIENDLRIPSPQERRKLAKIFKVPEVTIFQYTQAA